MHSFLLPKNDYLLFTILLYRKKKEQSQHFGSRYINYDAYSTLIKYIPRHFCPTVPYLVR